MLYPVVLRAKEGERYSVTVPDLPGCATDGENFNDAMIQAQRAIELHLEHLAEIDDEIPLADGVDAHIRNARYAGGIWAVIAIDIAKYQGKTEKINVTLPTRIVRQIDEVVKGHPGIKSRSSFLAECAREKLEQFK